MRPFAFGLALLLALPAFAGDRRAPTGFVVAPEEDEDDVQKPSKNPDEEPAPTKKPKKKREAQAPAWTEQPPARGLSIVDENAVAPTVIRAGDLESERAGKPLLNGGKGIGVVQPVAPVGRQGSFTFKASASDATPDDSDDDEDEEDDEAPAAPVRAALARPSKAAPPPKAPRAPSSMLMPVDTDDDGSTPARRGGADPFEDSRPPTPAPQRAPSSTTVNLHEDDASGVVSSSPRGLLPSGKVIGGSGDTIKVEEVHVDYQQDSFIDVGGRRKSGAKKKPEPVAKPPPAHVETIASPEPVRPSLEPAPEARPNASPPAPDPVRSAPPPVRAAPEPEPEPTPKPLPSEPEASPEPRRRSHRLLLGDEGEDAKDAKDDAPVPAPRPPEPSRRAVVGGSTDANPPEKQADPATTTKPAEDPFEKLNRDLRELEGRPLPEPAPEPKHSRAPETKPEIPPEPDMAVKPIDSRDPATPSRDPSILGVSAGLIVGTAIADDPVSGYRPDLAYGVGLMLNPSFLGPIALDLSLVRATRSGGTSFVSVDSAWNHIAARVLYVKEQPNGLFFGFGPGLLLTANTATYNVNDGHATSLPASQLRVGVDGSAIIGLRLRPLEIRLDVRTLLRGGFRLDFLPTASVGVAF